MTPIRLLEIEIPDRMSENALYSVPFGLHTDIKFGTLAQLRLQLE